MKNFTTETYQMKREIVHFANKISTGCNKVQTRFNTDMIYGILASGSCLLTEITDTLKEESQKENTVERLARHLNVAAHQTFCMKTTSAFFSISAGWESALNGKPRREENIPGIIGMNRSKKYLNGLGNCDSKHAPVYRQIDKYVNNRI